MTQNMGLQSYNKRNTMDWHDRVSVLIGQQKLINAIIVILKSDFMSLTINKRAKNLKLRNTSKRCSVQNFLFRPS